LECIFCGRFIDNSLKSKEPIIPDCIGGRLKCRNVCRDCNSNFGNEFERDLIESFGIIQDFLGLKSNGRDSKVARFTYNGRRVRINKKGPQLVDIKYEKKENGTGEHFFPNVNSMRRHYEKQKLKDPTIDIDETIKRSDIITTEIKSPLIYKSKFSFDKIFRASAKMIYEFLFSIRPNIKISTSKFRDYIKSPNSIINLIIYNEYLPYQLNRNHVYHILVVEAKNNQKTIYGYVELYSSLKILFLIDDNYLGPPFLSGYYFDLMEGKGYYEKVKNIPKKLGDFLEQSQDFNPLDFYDELGYLLTLAATKARLFPLIEELLSVKSKILKDDSSNKKMVYIFTLKSINVGLKRVGIEETTYSERESTESLIDKIIITLSRLKSTFVEWDISVELIDELLSLLR